MVSSRDLVIVASVAFVSRSFAMIRLKPVKVVHPSHRVVPVHLPGTFAFAFSTGCRPSPCGPVFPSSDYYDGSDAWCEHRSATGLNISPQASHVPKIELCGMI
jgi:hypothetical protein